MTGSKPVAVLFTQQFVGLNTRKTGMVFWTETLARRGFDTYAVTVQLSLLSKAAGSHRPAWWSGRVEGAVGGGRLRCEGV